MSDLAASDDVLLLEMNEDTLERYWRKVANRGFARSCDLYARDAVLEFPQSGRVITGRDNIQRFRDWEPERKMLSVVRLRGEGDLGVTEYTCIRNGSAVCVVSIMEFDDGKIRRETEYAADRL
jgi:hypothetical protein